MAAPDLAVVIPVLNEVEALRTLLPQLVAQTGLSVQVIVCDGGSEDDSVAVARSLGASVVVSARGRGLQLNTGAAAATAPWLLFLHADSQLTDRAMLAAAFDCMRDAGADRAGHFALRFARTTGGQRMAYRYLEEKTRCGRRHTINGDQGLLIGRDYFVRLGGFDQALPFFEDQLIAERIYRSGQWLLLPGVLLTSARRFEEEGFHRRYILMSLIMGLYWSDVRQYFARAAGLYRQQKDLSRLRLSPFLRAVWDMMVEDLGWRESWRAWMRIGRYVRQNSWQMFFFIDVFLRPWLGPERYPATAFHDRVFAPLIDNRVADLVTMVLVFVWFMGCLWPYFRLTEGVPPAPRTPGTS